jgi:twitching motility protein PilT
VRVFPPAPAEAQLAATGTAPIQVSLDPSSANAATDDLLAAMLRANPRVSDLIFSPGRNLQVQINDEFVTVERPGVSFLTADDTRRIASDLIGNNKAAIGMLREQGYCDVSYALPGLARFRVNVFIQRGSCAVVMRVIPTTVPDFKLLGAPEKLREVAALREGLVLIAGPRGSGKSSTLAACLNHINETQTCHIITIEDPIEFLHSHQRATIHQRELHSDTPSVAFAMRAALRQVPNVIAVGELKDRETMELALEAAETGHLVLSTMNTLNAHKTVERFVGAFPAAEQAAIRERLGLMLRCVISQRLLPRKNEGGRVGVFEIVNSGPGLLGDLLDVRSGGKRDTAALRSSSESSGLDAQLERLVASGTVTAETALAHATDACGLAKRLAAARK